jgi:hypothetical protein
MQVLFFYSLSEESYSREIRVAKSREPRYASPNVYVTLCGATGELWQVQGALFGYGNFDRHKNLGPHIPMIQFQ